MPDLRIDTEQAPAALLARVHGEAGLAQEEALERELTRIILLRPTLVILDLSGLAFLSSLGMGALVAFKRGLALHDGRVKLANPRQNVLGALRHARLQDVLEIHATVDAALASTESAVP